jgi:hypothetical protein
MPEAVKFSGDAAARRKAFAVLKYVCGRQTRQVVEVEHDPHLQQMARE